MQTGEEFCCASASALPLHATVVGASAFVHARKVGVCALPLVPQSHNSDASCDSVMKDIEQFGRQLLEAQNQAIVQHVRAVAAATSTS